MFCLQLKQNKTKQHIRTLEAACFLCVCVCFCLLVGHVFCLQSPPSSYTLKFTHKKQGSRLKPWQLHVVFSCVFFCLLAMQHLPTALCFLLKKKKDFDSNMKTLVMPAKTPGGTQCQNTIGTLKVHLPPLPMRANLPEPEKLNWGFMHQSYSWAMTLAPTEGHKLL